MPSKPSAGPVILNNTPLIALWSLNQLSLLRDLYGEVLIPQAVYEEFLATKQATRQTALNESPWIKRKALSDPKLALVYVGLDQGEAEVLALANEQAARLVIIDEHKGRRYAQRLSLPLTGTVGVLLAAKHNGLISAIAPRIDQLIQDGLFLSQNLVAKAREIAGED